MVQLLHRAANNPIITAADLPYPVNAVFNPGAARRGAGGRGDGPPAASGGSAGHLGWAGRCRTGYDARIQARSTPRTRRSGRGRCTRPPHTMTRSWWD
jgi:hypothetical protein